MTLRSLPRSLSLRGKRVLLRVDWNVALPIARLAVYDAIKIERSLKTIKLLRTRGAIVVLLTHLGRPKGRDLRLSARPLADFVTRACHLPVVFHPESIGDARERDRMRKALAASGSGTVHLLENVRFESGEEKNDRRLARVYASFGDYFINDAFASSHRASVTVSGLASLLPSYAGPQLIEENKKLSVLIDHPRRPFVAIVGGLKVSTKEPVLNALQRACDLVLVGGAMATTLEAARGSSVGRSFVERSAFAEARALVKKKNILLPIDARVMRHGRFIFRSTDAIQDDETVVDIGPKTFLAWKKVLQRARMIVWNGPVGKIEERPASRGTKRLIRLLARCRAFTVVGGGDTIPFVYRAHLEKSFSHLSMGGGAMLEFLEKKGKLPGLISLQKK